MNTRISLTWLVVPIGMAAVDIGKALGATVIACCSSDEKLEIARVQGADVLINYSEGDFKAKLKKANVYGNIDVVYDPVGGICVTVFAKSTHATIRNTFT